MTTRVNVPELKKYRFVQFVNGHRYMDKRLLLQLNCNRRVTGVMRGFDPFMNIVLDEAVEERSAEQRIPMGLAVKT
jgi:small nuclear ribonucleoprotein G